MKQLRWVLALVLVAGCSPRAGQPVATPPEPSPQAITTSRYTATLHSSTQKTAQVYLFAADEQAEIMDAPYCGANTGDTERWGHYEVFLAVERNLISQAVSPYPDMLLRFNDQRQHLQVLPGASGYPDLLALWQYGSCSQEQLAVLALTPDGKSLVAYRFKSAEGQIWPSSASRGLEQPGPGLLETTTYNNANGQFTKTTWAVRESEGLLEAVRTETKSLRP